MATVTTVGLGAIAKMIAGVSPPSPFIYMSTGQGSTVLESIDNTALETEHGAYGFGRVAATCEYLGNNTIRWSHIYTASGDRLLAEAGIFNDPTTRTGDMFLRHVLASPISFIAGDQVEISFTFTMTV